MQVIRTFPNSSKIPNWNPFQRLSSRCSPRLIKRPLVATSDHLQTRGPRRPGPRVIRAQEESSGWIVIHTVLGTRTPVLNICLSKVRFWWWR